MYLNDMCLDYNNNIVSRGLNEISISHLLNQVSHKNINTWINTISSYYTRHTKSNYIDDVANWLNQELVRLCYENIWFHNYSQDEYRLKNVICHKGGSTDKTVLICAHYDSIMEDIKNSQERAPGANDNASGMSVVLELARILSNFSMGFGVTFAFFSGEEQGLWGSSAYAKQLHQQDKKIEILINLDMVGRPPAGSNTVIVEQDNGNAVQSNDYASHHYGEIMRKMATLYTDLKAISGPIYNSDYMPFEALGYPVIGLFDDGEQNPIHHSRLDNPSSLNLQYVAKITKAVLATLFFINEKNFAL